MGLTKSERGDLTKSEEGLTNEDMVYLLELRLRQNAALPRSKTLPETFFRFLWDIRAFFSIPV